MKKKLGLAGVIAVLTVSVIGTPTLHAQTNRDPVNMGCKDATIAGSPSSISFKSPQDIRRQDNQLIFRKGQLVEIKVELRRSEKCQGKWVKAYNVPKNSQLYVENNSQPYPRRYVTYIAQVNGQNYSDMSNPQDYRQALRGCVQFPQEVYKYSNRLRQPLCTGFSQ